MYISTTGIKIKLLTRSTMHNLSDTRKDKKDEPDF